MVSKNHEILTIASRHHREGLHQIGARNSKVENTRHIRYLRAALEKNWFEAQNSIKTPQNDLKLCKEDQYLVGRLLLHDHRLRQKKWIREELIKFLRWKDSTHVIDQPNTKEMNRIGLKTKNQASREKGQRWTREEQDKHKAQSSQNESRRTRSG
jgi:hypothetical protein